MYNYKKLMSLEPTKLGSMTNTIGQVIDFYENPIEGMDSPIICVCNAYELAANSGFYDLADMTEQKYKEYEPSFHAGKLYIGQSVQ